jgi:hypothetical protein
VNSLFTEMQSCFRNQGVARLPNAASATSSFMSAQWTRELVTFEQVLYLTVSEPVAACLYGLRPFDDAAINNPRIPRLDDLVSTTNEGEIK